MVIKQEKVGERIIAILYPAHNGLYCVETKEYAPNWCMPWEVRHDGYSCCSYSYATNRKQAMAIFNEMVTREKMYA